MADARRSTLNPEPAAQERTLPTGRKPTAFPDDLALVQATLRGDARAVDAFVDRLGCVPRYLSSRNRRWGSVLQDHELCDLVQDVLTVLWRRRESYLGDGPLEGWACGTGLLQFYNRVRRQRRARVVGEPVPDELADLPPERLHQMDRSQVLHALDSLPASEQRVIRAKHFEDLSFSEIGHALDMSPNTVKTCYYRGLSTLRRVLLKQLGGAEAR